MKVKKILLPFLLVMVLLCTFSITGEAQWKNCKGGRRYYTSKTVYVKSAWKKIGKYWFYFDQKGYQKTGRFKVDADYYYVKKSTGRVTSKKVDSYYYNKDGRMVKSTWVKIGKHYFYFGDNGKIKNGKFTVKEKTYYTLKSTGRIENQWYKNHYYGKNGVMAVDCWKDGSRLNKKGDICEGIKNQPNKDEIRLLAALVYYEAGNQSYYGKKCVASVVVNRMKSKKFPNTLKGVIYQSGQFTPAMNGTVTSLYKSSRSIQKESVNAAKYVLQHGSVSKLKGYFYFNNFSGKIKVGDHYFS